MISHKTSKYQQGVSLVVVLIILVIVSILGVAGMQLSMMAERGARNERDYQMAWQASEAGLIDAELDINDKAISQRAGTFGLTTDSVVNVNDFVQDCGASGDQHGLCAGVLTDAEPAWLAVDFNTTGSGAHTVKYGEFTNRQFPAGGLGIQSNKEPRYVVELFPDPQDRDRSKPPSNYIFRVTSMGFGPRADIQAVTQMMYRN